VRGAPHPCWRRTGHRLIQPGTPLLGSEHSWKEVIEFLLEVNAGRNAAALTPGSSVGRSQAHKIKDRFKVRPSGGRDFVRETRTS